MAAGNTRNRARADWSTAAARPPDGYFMRATQTTVDGIKFASKLEADRWSELRMMEKANQIVGLKRQVSFPIVINGVRICEYVADFTYTEPPDNFVVEDAKGATTKLYLVKRRLMLACHNIAIRERYRDQVK